MKARNNIIDRNEVIWLSLIAVPIRIIVTFFSCRRRHQNHGRQKSRRIYSPRNRI